MFRETGVLFQAILMGKHVDFQGICVEIQVCRLKVMYVGRQMWSFRVMCLGGQNGVSVYCLWLDKKGNTGYCVCGVGCGISRYLCSDTVVEIQDIVCVDTGVDFQC